MNAALTLLAFWSLVIATAWRPERRAAMRAKARGDWVIELVNLLVQGALIPLVLVVLLAKAYGSVAPGLRGALALSPPLAFLLNFVVVDYLYYWNHRLLHRGPLFRLHLVHHTSTAMDVFATSRNTVWTSFLIVYVWLNSIFVYLLADATYYVAAATLTAILDLWRHSPLQLPNGSFISRALGYAFVLPEDHAAHHDARVPRGNFAANFKLWDRLHGTYLGRSEHVASRPLESDAAPKLGVATTMSFSEKLFWPISRT